MVFIKPYVAPTIRFKLRSCKQLNPSSEPAQAETSRTAKQPQQMGPKSKPAVPACTSVRLSEDEDATNAQLRAQLTTMAAQLAAKDVQLEQERKASLLREQELKAKLHELEQVLKKSEQALKESEQARMAERKAHASELKRTLRALSAAQHAAATSTAQRNNCEGQIITLKQANASLNKQLAVAKTHNHSTRDKTPTAVRLAKAETHIATLQREKDAATEQLAARDAELRKLEQMSSVASEMGHTFKARLADTQKQLEQATLLLKATQADLQAAHARNEETLMNGAFALIKREGEVASIKEQWEAVLKSMEDTEAVCEALRKENKFLRSEMLHFGRPLPTTCPCPSLPPSRVSSDDYISMLASLSSLYSLGETTLPCPILPPSSNPSDDYTSTLASLASLGSMEETKPLVPPKRRWTVQCADMPVVALIKC